MTSKQTYPGYRDTVITNAGAFPVSWVVMLLPFMDNRPAYDLWKQTTLVSSVFNVPGIGAAPSLEFMACPSDVVTDTSTAPFPNSYVVNTGQMDVSLSSALATASIYPDTPANGPFLSRWEYFYSPQANGGTTLENKLPKTVDANFFDGKTNTFVLSENIDAKNWYDEMSIVPGSSGSTMYPYNLDTNNGYKTAPYPSGSVTAATQNPSANPPYNTGKRQPWSHPSCGLASCGGRNSQPETHCKTSMVKSIRRPISRTQGSVTARI